jgi:hypothetical protein
LGGYFEARSVGPDWTRVTVLALGKWEAISCASEKKKKSRREQSAEAFGSSGES